MTRLLAGLWLLAAAPAAFAGADYDPSNVDWNGGTKLLALAREMRLAAEPRRVLDLGALDLRTALLFLGPRSDVPAALERFVREGGRIGVADDAGAAAPFLARYGLTRVAEPRVSVAYGGLPHLALAFPRRRHLLTWGVDALVTNHPAAFRSERRRPLLGFEGDDGLLFAVRDENGEVVALGDPSVLVNQMLAFGDNEHFARGLLRYLTRGTPGRPLWILHGAFEVRGALREELRPRGAAGVAAELRALAEDGAFGVASVGWELSHQRPIPGIFMALAVFVGGLALLLCAALWGGGAALPRLRRAATLPSPSLDRAGRPERARLGSALRGAIEERLEEVAADERVRARLRTLCAALPAGEADPAARAWTPRRLRRALTAAERALGPLWPRGG
jgi:hypothetical protein